MTRTELNANMCLIKAGVNGGMDRRPLVKMSEDEGKKEKKWKEKGKKREWGEMSANETSTARAVLFRQELVVEVAFTFSGTFLLWITNLVYKKII